MRFGVVLIVVGLAYAWIASGVRTFTRPAEVLTGIPIMIVAILLVVGRRSRDERTDRSPRWLLRWLLLDLALLAWEFYELVREPRHDYPTISSIGDAVLRTSRVTHALAFAAWLAIGAFLTRRTWMRSA